MTNNNSVTCNNCSKDFDMRQAITKTNHQGYTQAGLTCPHCQSYFHSYYTTPELEDKRKQLNAWRRRAARHPDESTDLGKRFKVKLDKEFEELHRKVQEEINERQSI